MELVSPLSDKKNNETMGNEINNTKAFIITLKFNHMQKQVFFKGEDSDQGDLNFKNTCLLLDKVGDTAKDWDDFFKIVINLFEKNGFIRIEK
jgi:hypothetical protein